MDTGTIEQAVTVAEGGTATAFGYIHQIEGGLQVGQISNYRVVGDSHFYELNPDQIEEEPTLVPPRAEDLAALLAEHRLLILAGELEDKTECARRIACRLRHRLVAQGPVSIRERCRGKDPQRIETAFQEGTTILLLTEISQSLIAGYGPAKLRRLLLEKKGYAIITTDCTRGQWEIADGTPESRLWQDLSWETYYGRDRLAGYLEQQLFGSELSIPEGLLTEKTEGEWQVGGVPLPQAAATLKTPGRIRTFVTSLVESETPPTPDDVEAKLGELAGDASAISQWYLQFNERDQLLVVGLVLLDGLPDDLLFAGLEILVETTWRETDPGFHQFDYRDLSRFAAYFRPTSVDRGFLRIESGSRQRRLDILRVAWNHQRRRLLATLPALTEMIRVSASEPAAESTDGKLATGSDQVTPVSAARLAAERALSRTKGGSMQLHQVVVESLSLIGLLSVEVVEPYLLDLAAGSSESLQLLVAQALAAWREAEKGQEFISLLGRWWSDACDVGNSDSAIAHAASLSPDPWAAVRATLALTVGFAAQYDRENRLAEDLFRLLEVLVDDPHPRVREAVWKHALPRAVAWHLQQLDDPFLGQRVLVSEIFVQAVARGAAEACEMRPQECLPIVERWWAEARADTRHAFRWAPGRREIRLATVALVYGYIRCSEGSSWMSRQVLVGNLRSILNEEGHPFVRRYALQAVEAQTRSDLELAARLLPDLLTRLTIEDRSQVAALAVAVYLHQRQHLEGGNRKIELDGRSYAVWTDRARPLTGIEATLYGWLLDRSRPVAQQLAVDIFGAFAASPLESEERRLLRSRPRAAAIRNGGGAAAAAEPEVRRLPIFGHLAVNFATLRREELRPLLRPLMAEVIDERHRQQALTDAKRRRVWRWRKGKAPAAGALKVDAKGPAGTERIEALLGRWGGVRNASAKALAGYLRRAIQLYQWRWALVLAMVLPLIGLTLALKVRSERFAEELVPTPDVLEDWMAPLPPGQLAEKPIRFPYVLESLLLAPDPKENDKALNLMDPLPTRPKPGSRRRRGGEASTQPAKFHFYRDPENEEEAAAVAYYGRRLLSKELWTIPKSFVLGDFAAPLPPNQLQGVLELRDHRIKRIEARQKLEKRAGASEASEGPTSPPPYDTPMERAQAWRRNILLTN